MGEVSPTLGWGVWGGVALTNMAGDVNIWEVLYRHREINLTNARDSHELCYMAGAKSD